MVTRFFSPPLTPLTIALPTTVSAQRCRPRILMMYSTLAQVWVRNRVRVRDHRTRARSAILGHYSYADRHH